MAICSDTSEVQPRVVGDGQQLPADVPDHNCGDNREADLLERFEPPRGIPESFLGRDRGDEESDERRHDPIVETALDVERPADPHRHRLVGDDRQAERGVGGCQDGGDQCRCRPPHRGEHQIGQQRAGKDRERQSDEQQPTGQTGIALDIP